MELFNDLFDIEDAFEEPLLGVEDFALDVVRTLAVVLKVFAFFVQTLHVFALLQVLKSRVDAVVGSGA